MHPNLGNKAINRIGYGTLHLPGIREIPEDAEQACRLLSEAVSLGANMVDTADFYNAELTNRLISEALSPCPENRVISGIRIGVCFGQAEASLSSLSKTGFC